MCFIEISWFYMKNRYFSKSTNSKRIVSHCAQKSDYPLSNKLGFSIRSHCLIKHHSQQGALVTNSPQLVQSIYEVLFKFIRLYFPKYQILKKNIVSKLYRETLFLKKILIATS